MSIKCDDGISKKEKRRFSEGSLIYVEKERLSNCNILLITKSGERIQAFIDEASQGRYLCYFESTTKQKGSCERIEE